MTGANGANPGARPGWRWDVALSFAGAQRDYVEQVAQALKARGVCCFYDADEQIELWGKYLAEELPAIYGEQAAAVVVFVSAEYAARDWTRLERRAALARAVRERREYVLPARFDDTPLPGLPPDMGTVDLRTRTPQQFAAMIAGKLATLSVAAPAPPTDAPSPQDAAHARGLPTGSSYGQGPDGRAGVSVAGRVNVDQRSPRVAARSAYLQQVRRIAPPDPPGLVGREAELEALAGFCLEPDRGPYVWWRAGAWAGKSALLSTFVLHPPPEVRDRVRIVSFFITARLAAQDTREAFTEVLLEQLADLTGQDLPAVLPDATREAHLLDLLAQAAGTCQEAGGRLVLVVDGLDEDRGVTTGPHAHSIAGLLPADPPAGMRVIVAGRPNPPIPDDVPDWHPLRDPGIIRQLPASPYARDVQRLGKQELQRLLHGTQPEQDLLGLVTAARGGLSGPDLEELTGAPLWEIEEILHTVAGRTFTRQTSRWIPGSGPEVYLLGHEELHTAACRYLGSQRLAGYHNRLHGWNDTYRAKGWLPGTPEYLLSGYYRLLVTLGDLPRMIACAGDPARHDRMLDLSGGDTAALAEVRTALDLIAAQDTPDLASALRLAYHRDQLTDRNTSIPTDLPAVWATLGQVARAEALATSITDPARQAEALAQVAGALAGLGAYEQAEAIARSVTDPYWQATALAQVAGALAGAGAHEQAAAVAGQAREVARSITNPAQQAEALAQVTGRWPEPASISRPRKWPAPSPTWTGRRRP